MWGICGSILPNEPHAAKYASHINPWFHALSLTTCDSWRRLRTLQTHTSAGTGAGAGGEQRLWSQCGKWTNESPGREWGWRRLAPGISGGLFWKDLGCEVLPQTRNYAHDSIYIYIWLDVVFKCWYGSCNGCPRMVWNSFNMFQRVLFTYLMSEDPINWSWIYEKSTYEEICDTVSYHAVCLIAHIQAIWDANDLNASLALIGACRWIHFWNVTHRTWWGFHQSKCSESHRFNTSIITMYVWFPSQQLVCRPEGPSHSNTWVGSCVTVCHGTAFV